MALGINTQGITLSVDNDASAAQVVGGVVSVVYGGGAATEIDTTSLADTSKTFIQGLEDRGSITIELVANFDDVGQIEFLDAMNNQEQRTMVLVRPTGTLKTDTFEVLVTSIESNGSVDDKFMQTVTAKITGGITTS